METQGETEVREYIALWCENRKRLLFGTKANLLLVCLTDFSKAFDRG